MKTGKNLMDTDTPLFFLNMVEIPDHNAVNSKPTHVKIDFYQSDRFLPYSFYKLISTII